MTDQQRSAIGCAIGCAIADLIGSYQAAVMLSDIEAHDWEAHRQSIDDLRDAFPDLLSNWDEIIDKLE